MSRTVLRNFLRNGTILFVFWMIFSGRFERTFLAIGILGAACVAGLQAVSMGPSNPTIPVVRFAWYLPRLLVRIVKSNLHIARLILDRRLPIAPRMIHYETTLRNEAAVALLANSITLTPGTVTVEALPGELRIHALDDASARDILDGTLEREISWIFEGRSGP